MEVILLATVIFMWIMFLWELLLGIRQFLVYKNTKEIPLELKDHSKPEVFEKSRLYEMDKSKFGFASSTFAQFESTAILLFGGIPFLWNAAGRVISAFGYSPEYEITQSMAFILLCVLYSTISSLPWSLYSTFVVEERHGFNKQTLGFYFKDLLKKLVLSCALSLPITAVLIWIIKVGGEYFFVYSWAFVLAVSLFLMTIYHDYIAPWFDRFMQLPDGDLRTSIENLASSVEFPLKKILVVEGSKRSAHSNAYFFGFFKNKRIVLFDTLLKESPFEKEKLEEKNTKTEQSQQEDKAKNEAVAKDSEDTNEENIGEDKKASENDPELLENKETVSQCEKKQGKGCSDEEILAVLGHELGHWKLNHTLKHLLIGQVNIFLDFFLFGLLMDLDIFYVSFGFTDSKPTLIGLLIIFQFIFSPYHELLGFCLTVLTRRFEFQADAFAKTLNLSKELQSCLIKLNEDNLQFPVNDKWFSTYHHSHPPLLERLRALKIKED